MAHLQPSRYPKEYEQARTAIANGLTNDGLALCELLLNDQDLPRYYRINTLILLASVSTDWSRKQILRLRAEHVWRESRDLYREGDDATTDSALNELRIHLDRLKSEQRNAVPSNYEDTLSAELAETKIENLADFAEGDVEAMADQEYEKSTANIGTTATQARGSSNGDILAGQAQDNTGDSHLSGAGSIQQGQNGHTNGPMFAPASSLPASIDLLSGQDGGFGLSPPDRLSRNGQTAGTRMVYRKSGIHRRLA